MQHVDVNTFQSRASHSHSKQSQHTRNAHMPRRFEADVEIGHKNSTAKDNRSHTLCSRLSVYGHLFRSINHQRISPTLKMQIDVTKKFIKKKKKIEKVSKNWIKFW